MKLWIPSLIFLLFVCPCSNAGNGTLKNNMSGEKERKSIYLLRSERDMQKREGERDSYFLPMLYNMIRCCLLDILSLKRERREEKGGETSLSRMFVTYRNCVRSISIRALLPGVKQSIKLKSLIVQTVL